MKIESLISTVNGCSEELVEKMKLETDALIVNQGDTFYYKKFKYKKHIVREYGFNERGVGKSRNAALMRSNADICLMADDDMVYVEGYKSVVKKAFEERPNADMIIFNVRIHSQDMIIEKVKKRGKVHYFNSLKYGTVSFAFKNNSIKKKNIFFSLLFGGGAQYSNGEDSLFLWNCLKKGLKIYTSQTVIADVYNESSSWFTGYNEKFFYDRGALFKALSPKFSLFLIYQFAVRKYSTYKGNISFVKSIHLMRKGAREF